jgi:hypothetical protein
LYDIGQWSSDLARLWQLAEEIPDSRQIYSIVAVAREPQSDWIQILKRKVWIELDNDLARVDSEITEQSRHLWRKLQLRCLIALISLANNSFWVRTRGPWAVISLDFADLGLPSRR